MEFTDVRVAFIAGVVTYGVACMIIDYIKLKHQIKKKK